MAGRPREFDRDEALTKARDLFWARGYEGTSMSDLVETLGLAPPRIYAAFGSKEKLFREAIALYELREGGFARRAFEEEPTARGAIEQMLQEAVEVYSARGAIGRPGKPRGCMVTTAAANCTSESEHVLEWLAERRRARTQAIIDRLRKGVEDGELVPETDVEALGDLFATILRGLSIQARDGVPKRRLLALISPALSILNAACAKRTRKRE